MKKVFIFGLSVALVAGSITSCKKTSKGKLSNEWKVTSWNGTQTDVDASQTDVTTVASADGAAISITNTITPAGGTAGTPNVSNGTINDFSYTINKDGTFEIVQDLTFTSTFTGGSNVKNAKTTTTGTWNFLSSNKTEDFKKNERVVFHTLSKTEILTETTTVNGTADPSEITTSEDTYITGQNSDIFVVVESKGKLLTLKSETSSTSTFTDSFGPSKNSETSNLEFTLEQK